MICCEYSCNVYIWRCDRHQLYSVQVPFPLGGGGSSSVDLIVNLRWSMRRLLDDPHRFHMFKVEDS